MTSEALRRGDISVDSIKNALTTCRGDIFSAAGYLSVSPRELDRYIRTSEEIQAFAANIASIKKNSDYDKLSNQQFRDELERLNRDFRIEATNVIHELATMDFDSAAMAEVKLKAAIQLRGNLNDAPVNTDSANVMAELNKIYQDTAPRIKSIRVAQIEFKSPEE